MKHARLALRAGTLACWIAGLPTLGCMAGDGDETAPGAAAQSDLPEGNAGSAGPAPPAFEQVYAVMERSCGGGMSGCHITGMSAGLAMPDVEAAHVSLVNVASSKCEGEVRVVPGDAESSLLVQVLEGSAACVKPMPLGRDTLSEEDIELVRAWIDDGALE